MWIELHSPGHRVCQSQHVSGATPPSTNQKLPAERCAGSQSYPIRVKTAAANTANMILLSALAGSQLGLDQHSEAVILSLLRHNMISRERIELGKLMVMDVMHCVVEEIQSRV